MQEAPFSAGPPASHAKKLRKRVQLVSGMGDQGIFDKDKSHHRTSTFSWTESNKFQVPTGPVLSRAPWRVGNEAQTKPGLLHALGVTVE